MEDRGPVCGNEVSARSLCEIRNFVLFDQAGRIFIQKQIKRRMCFEQGSGYQGSDGFAVQSVRHGLRFYLVRNAGNDMAALHDLISRHGNRLFGNIVHGGKPALADLLLFAALVQIHNDVRFPGFEICGGIVEGDVRRWELREGAGSIRGSRKDRR